MNLSLIASNLPMLFCSLFVAILFLQSGFDKLFDWKGNLDWLTGHFAKSIFAGSVSIMLATLTLLEIATGFLAAAGLIYQIATGSAYLVFVASIVGATTLTALFFGQRVARDYPGAAVLVPYFLLMLTMMYLSNPFKPN